MDRMAVRPMAPGMRSTWLLSGMLLLAVVGLQMLGDRVAPARREIPVLWLQSPDLARRVALSFRDIAADVYWIRAVVHYGSERRSTAAEGRYALLHPLLNLATSLDRRFDVAARLGAIFLSEGFPGGPGRPDLAIALLQKGLANEPSRWQYRHDLGFVHYWWLNDYPEAARQFQAASTLPGAPPWLKTLAGVTLAKGGDRAGARLLWEELLANNDLDWVRRTAEYRLQQLQAMDELDVLLTNVAAYMRTTGTAPTRWEALVERGLLKAVPVDPSGMPYALLPGGVALAPDSPLVPLPLFEAPR
jgi:tetratricopeptide (TPR) repeat protein